MRKRQPITRLSRRLGSASLCSIAAACSLIYNADDYVGEVDASGNGDARTADAAEADSAASAATGGTNGGGSGGMDGSAAAGGTQAGTGGLDGGLDGSAAAGGGEAGPDGAGGMDAPACEEPAECGDEDEWWACHQGICVNCDNDGDGWAARDSRCDPEVPPGMLRDCDDQDEEIYPHAPAVCGDGKVNSCALEVPSALQQQFQVAEIGILPPYELTLDADNPVIEISNATQISVAGSDGEATDQTAVLVSFMDDPEQSGNPQRRARLLAYDIWDDGWLDYQGVRALDLNEIAQAEGIESVGVQRIEQARRTVVSFIGTRRNSMAEVAANWVWHLDLASGEEIGTADIEPVAQQVPAGCNPMQQMLSRLAISSELAPEEVGRTTWVQVASGALGRADIVSYDYETGSFQCPPLEDIEVSPGDFVQMSGSSGPFVLGSVSGNAFVWEGIAAPVAEMPRIVTQEGRPAWAYVGGDEYLAATSGADSYQSYHLTCTIRDPAIGATAQACSIQWESSATLNATAELAAMDNIGDSVGVLALVERTSQGSVEVEELVLRILDSTGPLTPQGYREQPPDQPDLAWRAPVVRHEYEPGFPRPSDDRRTVDVAVSAWADETGLSLYPLTIVVAGIVTNRTLPMENPPGGVEPGQILVLSGLRGCRQP